MENKRIDRRKIYFKIYIVWKFQITYAFSEIDKFNYNKLKNFFFKQYIYAQIFIFSNKYVH